MDAHFNYTTQLTADRMAGHHRAATAHRMRRAASAANTDSEMSQEPAVSAPRHLWSRMLRWHPAEQRTVAQLDAG